MTKPKTSFIHAADKSQRVDGVWAGGLQNWWFLAQRELGAGIQADVGGWRWVVRCDGTDDVNSPHQTCCMARLAISTGLRGS